MDAANQSRPAIYLLVGFMALVCLLPSAAAAPAQQGCVGEEICYEDTPEPPANEPPPPPWDGYSDGRLNPQQGEYYTVYCKSDLINVWRGVPEPLVIKTIPLGDVFNLEEGGVLDLGDAMSLVRNTSDTITIYGSNGNLAPEAGSKAFSLSECVARNGRLPDSEEPPAAPPGETPPQESDRDICLSLDNLEDVTDCLAGLELSGVELLFLWVFQFCSIGLVGIVMLPGGWMVWRHKRRKAR